MIYVMHNVPIVGGNAFYRLNRQRYTIEYEVGHLEAHRDLIERKARFDKGVGFLRRDGKCATGTNAIEIEVHQFAVELLLDEALAAIIGDKGTDVDDEPPIEEHARCSKISKKAMEYRVQRIDNRLLASPSISGQEGLWPL